MRTKAIPSSWLHQDGRRLDCWPYMSGALEARVRLETMKATKVALKELTLNGMSGLVNAGRFRRIWVNGADHGVPFLSSTEILNADLSHVSLISRRAVEENPKLLIREGWTLITRSGTIGRMSFARPDMDGMACSEHVLRVIPDTSKIPAGYLYAYLSGRFGVPLVVAGTYGAIIQHIEPEHIADLPVPRLPANLEAEADKLVREAAKLRAQAAVALSEVAAEFDAVVAEVNVDHPSPRVTSVPASTIQGRFDAQFHDPVVRRIRAAIGTHNHVSLGEWCNTIFLPGIFKRIHIDDPRYGAPYFTGATLFCLEPQAKGILSRRTSLFDQVVMERGTVLVQAFGQDGGLTGRAVWVGEHLDGSATTHMLVRLRAEAETDTAYLFGFLQSSAAYQQIACLTYGGSIPHFDEAGISTVTMPLLPNRDAIAKRVLDAVRGRDRALSAEREARRLVENAIVEAAA